MTTPLAVIIEDDQQIAEIAALAVQEAGFQAEVITDGNTALTRLRDIQPDLILLDLHLPMIRGIDILEEINKDKRLDSCKVILATADAFLAYQHQSEANLVLIKPISFTKLRNLAMRLRPAET